MKTADVLNYLIKTYNYKSYLEIGVQLGRTFRKIKCETKVGVDPDPMCEVTFKLTSDKFFENNESKFDLVFIDGLHLCEQVVLDFENSIQHLNEGGCIVFDDVLPRTKSAQLRNLGALGAWNGDCWKSIVYLRCKYGEDWTFRTLDASYGLTIAMKSKDKKSIED